MKVVSIIHDGLLNADNVLIEMTISDYLSICQSIILENPYQRRRVKDGASMYSLLNQDLRRQCTMPPIVLAFDGNTKTVTLSCENSDEEIRNNLKKNHLIILDGLQRTYTIIDINSDLFLSQEEKSGYFKQNIRVELYVGLSNSGILYRMLTLNSGQTPMSKRHQIEILYSRFRNSQLDRIKFISQLDNQKKQGIDDYDFDDAIEGFNSYITGDESPIDKSDILKIIQRMDKIIDDDYQKDLFEEYIRTYNQFVHKIDELTDSWQYTTKVEMSTRSLYGKDIAHIFCKSQTMSAFGSAIGTLIQNGIYKSLSDFAANIDKLIIGSETDAAFGILLGNLEKIRQTAPKIGVEQRKYLRFLFQTLFATDNDVQYNLYMSIIKSFELYQESRWKPDMTDQPSLF